MQASEPLPRPTIEETKPTTEQVLDTECRDCDGEKDTARFDNLAHGNSRSYFKKADDFRQLPRSGAQEMIFAGCSIRQ